MNSVMFASSSSDWNTPEAVLEPLRRFAGDAGIGLDPCSNGSSVVSAKVEWSLDRGEDGLALPWDSYGYSLVYVNPPYDRKVLGAWVEKVVKEAKEGAEIVVLVAARTDTRWFRRLSDHAQAICFWSGRIRFLGGTSCAPFPSALVYFGHRKYHFADVFGSMGTVMWR